MQWMITTLLLLNPPESQPLTPAQVWQAAAADLQTVQPNARPLTRYLSLAAIPEQHREKWFKVLAYHVNALSTESDVVVPSIVGNGNLIRLLILDYGWTPGTWEQLADSEPYYHVRVRAGTETEFKVFWPGGKWEEFGGAHYERGIYAVKRCKKEVIAIAPWVVETKDGTDAAKVLTVGTLSGVPVVDARWFLWQTAVQTDRKPGYYDFLGIKDKATFDAMVGFDAKLAEKSKRVELLEAVADSTVTLQPRRIGAFPAISGNYWQTFDNREAKDANNPLRILNGGLKFDAMEVFGALPNNLMVWGLFDAQGKRQDTAPDFIASDATAHGTDRRVHAGLSCVRCHGVHAGVQPVDGWARNLFKGPLTLQSPDYDKLKELRQKYLRDLEVPMAQSRATYEAATKQACGMPVKELAKVYGEAFAEYDGPVSVERASRDAGMTAEHLRAGLRNYLKARGEIDTVTATFLSERKGGIRITQYHEQFPLLMLAVRGLAQ